MLFLTRSLAMICRIKRIANIACAKKPKDTQKSSVQVTAAHQWESPAEKLVKLTLRSVSFVCAMRRALDLRAVALGRRAVELRSGFRAACCVLGYRRHARAPPQPNDADHVVDAEQSPVKVCVFRPPC